MKFTSKVYELILNNKELRLRIALALSLSEQSVISAARRKGASLQKYHAVELLKEYGLSIDEIFEKAKPAFSQKEA